MKANELRLGNWVEYINNSGHFQVTSIEDGYIERGFLGTDQIKGIPITEEWLLKFGFRSNPYQDRYELDSIYFEGCKLNFECDKTKGWTELWCEKYPKIEFVHQLQNLFFAVTGEELIQVIEG